MVRSSLESIGIDIDMEGSGARMDLHGNGGMRSISSLWAGTGGVLGYGDLPD